MQARLLCGPEVEPQELEDKSGFTAKSKYGMPITWYTALSDVPASPSPFILAHEFFDALPIHAFEATEQGWRELMVSPVAPGDAKPTVIGGVAPEFALTRSQVATPHARLLPELSERYRALKKHPGSIIEISPESLTTMEEIAKRIGTEKAGAALVVDYGPLDTIPINSLRGIRSHRIVSPFSSPGEVDVSADVDFHALAERALMASENVEVHGPVEQGAFLGMMGMRERMEQLAKGLGEGEKKKQLQTGVDRLMERGGGAMGKVYKVMAVVPERGGVRPVGFGGGVQA
jgi:NADH dehydrogenase [ubiquinone] 1 alpha subcomplex assembly factor 7